MDIGCGRGDFDFWLAERGYELECFEFSEAAIEEFEKIWQKKQLPNIKLRKADFFNYNQNPQADVVMCFEVLEHIKEDGDAVEKMRQWLKPGGYLIISVPAHMSMWGKDDEVVGHARRYEKQELNGLIEKAGLSVIQFYAYGFPWMNILKKIREIQMKIKLPAKIGTKHSGVGFFKTDLFKFLFNSITFAPLIAFSKLFHKSDLAEGYFVVAKKNDASL